ncbi:hypothetical protein K523DRAFT_157851 [Schizophyllum commune Tattone D]|nr:hypothetical protein K523DRAFT_157851 [Schizophyllum commune Tattone D]
MTIRRCGKLRHSECEPSALRQTLRLSVFSSSSRQHSPLLCVAPPLRPASALLFFASPSPLRPSVTRLLRVTIEPPGARPSDRPMPCSCRPGRLSRERLTARRSSASRGAVARPVGPRGRR